MEEHKLQAAKLSNDITLRAISGNNASIPTATLNENRHLHEETQDQLDSSNETNTDDAKTSATASTTIEAQQKKYRRIMANRRSAKASRERQKIYVSEQQSTYTALLDQSKFMKNDNHNLKERLQFLQTIQSQRNVAATAAASMSQMPDLSAARIGTGMSYNNMIVTQEAINQSNLIMQQQQQQQYQQILRKQLQERLLQQQQVSTGGLRRDIPHEQHSIQEMRTMNMGEQKTQQHQQENSQQLRQQQDDLLLTDIFKEEENNQMKDDSKY